MIVEEQAEYGLDNLARSLGLDIEAIALRLATQGDLPPVQTHIFTDKKPKLAINKSPERHNDIMLNN